MIAIIDYDAGNLKSVEKAVAFLGDQAEITRDPEKILNAKGVILPGGGAFGDAMENLKKYHLPEVIHKTVNKKIPFLGICLGLQLLFEESEESPGVPGLGICRGKILRIPNGPDIKIPHMGWNSLNYDHPGRFFRGVPEGSYVYFVHSYYLKAADPVIVTASAFYSVNIHASIQQEHVFGCQFHPEKSGETGLAILKNFIDLTKEG